MHGEGRHLQNNAISGYLRTRPSEMDMTKVLLLYDEITAGTAKRFIGELSRVAGDRGFDNHVNSPGGNVNAGEGYLRQYDATKASRNLRYRHCCSAASYIAMAAAEVEMAAGSFLMVHNPFAEMFRRRQAVSADWRLRWPRSRRVTLSATPGAPAIRGQGPRDDGRRNVVRRATGSRGRLRRRVRRELEVAARVSAMALKYKHAPAEVRAMAKSSHRTPEQRARLRRRLQFIAMQARFGRDPKRDEADRERGARMRRRYEMQAMVEAIKADDRKVDAAERAANAERQRATITTTTGIAFRRGQRRWQHCGEYPGAWPRTVFRRDPPRSSSCATRCDALDRAPGGLDPEQLAEIVASRLAPQLDAARRAARTGRRTPR